MSELTPCNYCTLREIKARTPKNETVTKIGQDVYRHPKNINIRKLPKKAREQYFVAWMMEIADHLCMLKTNMNEFKEYIGDSVYANFDGYYIILTTENNKPDDPSNIIALEPSVLKALDEYRKRLEAKIEEYND